MAAASLSSLSLRLQPAGRSRPRITTWGRKPERWRRHWEHRGATTQLHKRKISLKPLCSGGTMVPGNPHHGSHSIPLSPSLSDMITDFYSSINEKDLSRLDKLIADNCIFEDLTFPTPFHGKEVHRFLKELTEAMGKQVRFSIEGVYEGGESFVGVMWHLEWNKEPIPFTKGCSIYECSRNGEKLLIRRARVFVESPVKPGDIVLEVLKIVSTLFDKFPKVAEKFLQKPNMMFQFILKAYKMFVEPFILPFLVYYTHIWTLVARILCYALSVLKNLLKFLM